MRKKLSNLASLHVIYPGQNVRVPGNRIVAVAFGGGDECQMNGDSLGSAIRAGEKTILSHKNPAFNGSFGFIVIDRDVRILQESGECQPVPERVIDRFSQLMGRSKSTLCADNHVAQAFYQLFRVSSPHSQPVSRGLALTVPLDFVQVSVNVEDYVADFGGGKLDLEISTSGMSVASCFSSMPVFVESIEAGSSIGLKNAFVVRKELAIPGEGLVRRIIIHGDVSLWTDVGCDFAFSNIILMPAVLNLDERVVSFYDRGLEQFFLLNFIQQRQCIGRGLHPIGLRRAWNGDVVASEDFMLPVVGQSIFKLADDDLAQEPRSSVTAGDGWCWFLSSDNILPALRAGACFLAMLNNFQACAYHFKLVSDLAVNAVGLNGALRTNCFFGANKVRHLLVRQMASVIENVFLAARFSFRRGRSLFVRDRRLRLCDGRLSGARIMLLGGLAVLFLVALFCLDNEDFEFRLQVLHQLAQLVVAVESLLKLPTEILDQIGEAFNFLMRLKVFLFQPCYFVFQGGTRSGITGNYSTICRSVFAANKKAPHLMPINVECLIP